MSKVSLEIQYNPVVIQKTGEFMSRLDLGIEGIEWPQTMIMNWTTSTEVTDSYKNKLEKGIRELFEKDGDRIIAMNWHKILSI